MDKLIPISGSEETALKHGKEYRVYRAVWISEEGQKIYGDLTDKADARLQVNFLKTLRTAWVEDANGKKVNDE